MARRIKDSALETREARRRLKPRSWPYWRAIERATHVGYRRRRDGAGTFVMRHYADGSYHTTRLGIADDLSDGDGIKVLTWWQAVDAARQRLASAGAAELAERSRPLTVNEAMDDYLEFLEANRTTARDARYRDEAFIRPVFGKLAIADLTADKIRRWHMNLAAKPPRRRTRKGEAQKFAEVELDDDVKRRRRASANRTLTVLKAALNRAWRDGKAPSDVAWRRVKPFEKVDAARVRYLTVAEATRLVNASEPEFKPLVRAALETGARYSELARLTVEDFNADIGTVSVRVSKSGRPRHVVLTDDGRAFFASVCAGRAGSELIFRRASGGPWLKSQQLRFMADACKRAKIDPPIGFHGLRHTWASLAVMGGVPLMVVAKNLGHADTRMVEKHYGHLAPSYIADAIRAGAPRFGGVESNVVPLA